MIVQVDPEASTSLVHKLALMQTSGELCDFTIIVSGSKIKVHKCVLAACCDYFKTSFHYSESSQSSTETDLTHLDCDVSVMENVIRSFYTNEIDLDPNSLEGILQLVDYFMCESLRLCIEMFMESTLTFHTAVLYFQLALQYRLSCTGLFKSAKWLMRFHFHDYFIYQPDTVESSMDIIGAYMTFDIFCHCNPLQLVEFMLNSGKNAVEKLQHSDGQNHKDSTKAVCETVNSTFQRLSILLSKVRPGVLDNWKPRLFDYLKVWKECNSECCSELFSQVQSLETELSNKELLMAKSSNTTQDEKRSFNPKIACTNPNCQLQSNPALEDSNINALWACLEDFEPDDEEYKATHDYCACTPKPIRDYLNSLEQINPQNKLLLSRIKPDGIRNYRSLNVGGEPQTLSITTKPSRQNIGWTLNDIHTAETVKEVKQSSTDNALSSFVHDSHPSSVVSSASVDGAESSQSLSRVALHSEHPDTHELQSDILVVLAPSAEMTAQLTAIEDEHARPLLRAPKLQLSYYDIDMNSWCCGCKLDFPIQGAMLEKHSWRMAYLDDCLYMFSLGREIGLQYDIVQNKWTHLDCQQIFTRHNNAAVKSVIPIKVGKRLIVLSMSREAKECGTFSTQQHYFEMQPISRTFVPVASVQDDRLTGVPVTQWTVSEDKLITFKASTMMYRNISSIQYIHIYNAEMQQLETHEVFCTMEAGIKVLVKDQIIYLIDREGWCRSYNLKSSTWTDLQRYCSTELSSSVGLHTDDSLYPALTHVSCHAGSSRWEVTTSSRSMSARMQEMAVNATGELSITSHPPPPFQFMTAMCPGTMSRSKLNNLKQPQFVYLDNQMLDFSYSSQMEVMV